MHEKDKDMLHRRSLKTNYVMMRDSHRRHAFLQKLGGF